MPNGGTILIKLEHDTAHQMVDLVVRDSGCGIPIEKLPRIFDPYYTTKKGTDESGKGGTGLGLVIVWLIVCAVAANLSGTARAMIPIAARCISAKVNP